MNQDETGSNSDESGGTLLVKRRELNVDERQLDETSYMSVIIHLLNLSPTT
jgi:hypothetical protein